jgi:hypothetical protein
MRPATGYAPPCAAGPNQTPLVDALREVLDAALRRLSSRSDMAKAIAYGIKRWLALCRFLDDGRLETDSNIAERALRGVAVGRRNWRFTALIDRRVRELLYTYDMGDD